MVVLGIMRPAVTRGKTRVKNFLWKVLPEGLLIQAATRLKRPRVEHRSVEEVFTEIYQAGAWGDSESSFHSGSGSHAPDLVEPYVNVIQQWLAVHDGSSLTLVDLGCGDFAVGRVIASHVKSYVGVDVVADLVAHNQARYGSPTVEFKHLNIVEDELPGGDVCVIRQVLQHLSNNQVGKVLMKLRQYKWVIITEHCSSKVVTPNLDKPHGANTRAFLRSGLVLDAPPFSIPKAQLERLLLTPVTERVGPFRQNRGYLETLVYTPSVSEQTGRRSAAARGQS